MLMMKTRLSFYVYMYVCLLKCSYVQQNLPLSVKTEPWHWSLSQTRSSATAEK